MSSGTLSENKESEAYGKNGSHERSQVQVVKNRAQDSKVCPPNDDHHQQADSSRQVFLSSSRSVDGLQALRQGNYILRRKFSSQSLHGGSRIVPTRLIGNNHSADHDHGSL
ncbi:uncharacterized protein PGTG_22346 [Puccinia graminis f. sp. tritici CRL 75-36-700-3]|uniref:Uncharacterized protein n=1 Tax=Puccinia graminis f. sp. tritici (strain CRL 75-36-700-3 / race SCCL) TaxID=418459 RepID=H6QUJ8_PUCGT|nr:uncharacterized protein PGTG_22346 [Puccinia graminis f. sp. tritici CRL 75-36-700-3]EHS64710.1 hypothetical protein PGTG_22346 [Puccinia graminis f. sp. tritici CRL 75-36-700-3]